MPDETTILSLPLILPAQAQKHVTHNEALVALDLIVQLAVKNRGLTVPPGAPVVGDRHIVAAGASGAWAGQAGKIALYSETGWQFTAPLTGWQAYVEDEGQVAAFDGSAWAALSDGALTVGELGVSATPDATNRLSVSSPAVLMNHAGAGVQLKLNKALATDTASLLFQTGFSGRAEMGTAGSDDFAVKVSADGATWASALTVAGASGEVTLPQPLHLGGQASDPASPVDGTLWLNTTTGEVKLRSGGATQVVGGVSDGDKGDVTVSGGGTAWAIDAGAVTLSKMASLASGTILGRETAGTGVPEALTASQVRGILNVADGATANASDAVLLARANHTGTQAASTITGLAAVATSGSAADLSAGVLPAARLPAFGSGDVSFATGGGAGTIAASAVTNAKLANMAGSSIKGNASGAAAAPSDIAIAANRIFGRLTGSIQDLTGTQVTTLLDTFSTTLKGLAPASGGGTVNFLRADGTWAVPSGGGVSDGDKGDVTVSGSGATWTIDADAVTFSKMQNIATDRLIGRDAAAAGDPEEIAVGGGIEFTGTGGIQTGAFTGDVTKAAGGTTLTVAANAVDNSKAADMAANTIKANATAATADPADLAVGANTVVGRVGGNIVAAPLVAAQVTDGTLTNAKLASVATATLKGRVTAGSGAPEDLTGTQATALLDTFSSSSKGLAPASGGGTANFLRADGTWAAPAGGGGAPGGSTAQLQYNNAGTFAGASSAVIEGNELRLPYIATPATPAASGLKLYGMDFGPGAPAFLLPSGKVKLIQSDLGDFNVKRFTPGVGSAVLTLETSLLVSALGTATIAVPANTNLHNKLPRTDFLVTTASTTAIAGWRINGSTGAFLSVGRDANAPGGFLLRCLWGPATGVANTTMRGFAGLANGWHSAPTDVEPSSRTNIIGMGWDAADANIQFMQNDGAGAATKTDLGASFPVPTTDRSQVYELQLYSPNSLTQSVSYRVIRYNTTDKTVAAEATGTVTTDLPAVSTLLAPVGACSVGGTSSVVGAALMGILVATEY